MKITQNELDVYIELFNNEKKKAKKWFINKKEIINCKIHINTFVTINSFDETLVDSGINDIISLGTEQVFIMQLKNIPVSTLHLYIEKLFEKTIRTNNFTVKLLNLYKIKIQ